MSKKIVKRAAILGLIRAAARQFSRKNDSEHTDSFPTVQEECAEILREERAKYVEELKTKLAALPKCSKQWWRINNELLRRTAKPKSVPPLRAGSDWLVDAKAKADVFANTFSSKGDLPTEVIDTPFLVRLIRSLMILSLSGPVAPIDFSRS